MSGDIENQLSEFAQENKFAGKGPLSVALVVTDRARRDGLPLNPDDLLTKGGGQVQGLGGDAVQAILNRHGLNRRLAREGGRTSRGSIGKMRAYVEFLNTLAAEGEIDIDAVERFWVERVKAFFAAQPFTIKLDAARGLRRMVRDVLAQAEHRQRESGGVYYRGTVLQHLVGAKLDAALGPGKVEHHSYSTADAPGRRPGDFLIGDASIHVTTSPTEAVIARCQDNLNEGLRPILVTLDEGSKAAEVMAANKGVAERIDIFEIEQFVALNLYELGDFAHDGRRTAISDLVDRYNEIVDEVETDPSLRIQLKA